MPSGIYIPKTGKVSILAKAAFAPLSLSDGSIPLPIILWFLYPKATIDVTVAVLIFTIASALFSWQVTHAVLLSSDIAMYSGSKSSATVAFRKKVPLACSLP